MAFLCHYEMNWFRNWFAYALSFYKRYIDVIFVLMKSENNINTVLTYLNSKHLNIRFTSQIKKYKSLTFLEINVYGSNDTLETSAHDKSTFP